MTKQVSTGVRPHLAVFIGRCQPPHVGHLQVIRTAQASADRMVILVGSANEPRTLRNPFTAPERIQMLRAALGEDQHLQILPLEDSTYNLNEWLERTQRTVMQAWAQFRKQDPSLPETPDVTLYGHDKDTTSYYLRLFPTWTSVEVPPERELAATAVRQGLFGTQALAFDLLDGECAAEKDKGRTANVAFYMQRYVERAREQAKVYLASQRSLGQDAVLPLPIVTMLEAYIDTPGFEPVALEAAHAGKTAHDWRHAPYPPLFQTVDAVVVQSGHVLMVKRKNYPGKGLWALPGGFLEYNETRLDGALRELDEETALKVPPAVLRGRLRADKVFDAPFRSSRGRTLTTAFLFHLDPGQLPKTKKGGLADDTETYCVAWIPISQLRRDECFEDHYSIIKHMTAAL